MNPNFTRKSEDLSSFQLVMMLL